MGISYEKSDVNSFFCMGVGVNDISSIGASFDIYSLSVGTFDISGEIRLINKSMFGTAITMDYNNDNILSVNLIQRFELNGFILYLNGGLEGDSIGTENFGISL